MENTAVLKKSDTDILKQKLIYNLKYKHADKKQAILLQLFCPKET